jgi:hypothetical protein
MKKPVRSDESRGGGGVGPFPRFFKPGDFEAALIDQPYLLVSFA